MRSWALASPCALVIVALLVLALLGFVLRPAT